MVALGAGHVERSIAGSTTTRRQARSLLVRKTITMETAAAVRRGSRKRTIVLEDIQAIAASVGKACSVKLTKFVMLN